MDIFKIEPGSSISGNITNIIDDTCDQLPEVNFDAGSEFNLRFFNTPDDSSTQGGFSDAGSVDESSVRSPSPSVNDCSNNCGGNLIEKFVGSGIGQFQIIQPPVLVNIKSEQQFATADSNSNSTGVPSKQFVPCKVCGDKASGYHYGVTSCEGCKGFFRRSIQKQIEYRCLRDGKCLVIRLNRNRCQFCRFKKCLSVGMSRDSVRYGRVPKRSRELCGSNDDNASIRVTTPTTPITPTTPQMCSVATPPDISPLAPDPELPGSTELSVYDVILCVSQAHRSHCTYIDESTRGIQRLPINIPMTILNNVECEVTTSQIESLENKKIWLWQQYASRITPSVQRVVEFAKRVPGFSEFSQDDQLILIKLGFFEVWLSHVTKIATEADALLTFDDGSYLTKEQLEILYDNEFVSAFQSFSTSVKAFGLSDTEVGLFSALVLLTSQRPGITEHKQISRIREKIAEALRVQIVRSRPGSTASLQLMPALEAKIPELRGLGARHCTHLDWLRTNWTNIRLPPLFAEIFDIPKSEDDLN